MSGPGIAARYLNQQTAISFSLDELQFRSMRADRRISIFSLKNLSRTLVNRLTSWQKSKSSKCVQIVALFILLKSRSRDPFCEPMLTQIC